MAGVGQGNSAHVFVFYAVQMAVGVGCACRHSVRVDVHMASLVYLPGEKGQGGIIVSWWRCTSRGRYHGARRPSSDDSFHSLTVIPPSALDKPSVMKRDHRRRTYSHTSPRRSPTMVTLHDTRFVECRWWNGGWTEKTVVT